MNVAEPLSFGTAFQVFGGLLAVLLVFAGLAFLLRRLTGTRASGGGRIRVVDGLMLGARDRLVLVQVGETEILLGLTPGRIQPLHVFQEPEGNGNPPFPAAFREALSGLQQEKVESC
jgi:flagellar protein FliO/FliZ